MIVLDTNVVSELMKPAPNNNVVRWIAARSGASFYTSSITHAEILHGIALLPPGRRRAAFEAAAKAMFEIEFAGRILPFGSEAAPFYAQLAAERRRIGRPISHFDAQIAAIARVAGAALATRNVADFDRCDIDIVNPWTQ